MKAVIQRVSRASVTVNNNCIAAIDSGLLILLGIETADTSTDVAWLCAKIAKLRIFNDSEGLMNCDISQIGGRSIVISQFTLHASTKKGNRPSFIRASRPEQARALYEEFVTQLRRELGNETAVQTGKFAADMKVELINDGPVTICIDTQNKE
ncbi:MAG: D-tyrosyl-tRNA(Tyr) deacylase [Bacteroidales bacterium]|jgi:D-tyrosyl-tRNA(Tyr) deacylase|nr:D-tyrosyl-tRNA(Tyr) deacylase [Bacteroidales bacterium]